MITLYRDTFLPDATLGSLLVGEHWFRTIELPWLDNQSNISCIPPGEYNCDFMARSASGKYRNVWHVRAVPSRRGILIHAGNLSPDHTRGCVLVGLRRGWIKGRPAVLNSKTALANILDLVGQKGFTLNIQEMR